MSRLSSLLLIVPCLLGCYPNYTILEHHDLTLPAGDKPVIVIEMHNGPITISTAPCRDITGQLTKRGVGDDKEEAEKELKAIAFDSDIVDGRIIIKVKRTDGSKSWNGSGAEATLQVPSTSRLELITSNCPVQVNGKNQGVKIKTSNSPVTLNGMSAYVEVTTSNGAVRATDVLGNAKIETSNGTISINGQSLALDCKSSNGSISCTGDLTEGNHKAITSNGQVTLTLPVDVKLNIDAYTSNGRIRNEFNLSKNSDKKKKDNSLKGTIGNGETTKSLVIKTSNNMILIKRDKNTTTDAQ